MEEIINKTKEVEQMFNKINLFQKKKERMGLTEEEAKLLNDLKTKYLIECETITNEIVVCFINSIINENASKALKEIQSIVPWSGGTLIDNKETDLIMIAEGKLTKEQRKFLEKELEVLHFEVFRSIELFCDSLEGYEGMEELSKIISNGESDDITDSLIYIDSIYRDFGEIFGIELPEIKVVRR